MTVRLHGLNGSSRLRGLAPVQESVLPYDGYGYLNPYDRFADPEMGLWPLAPGWGGYGIPRERTGAKEPSPAGMLSEQELRGSIVWSRWLCDRNPLALGFLCRLRDFTYGDGADWKVTLRGADTGATTAGLDADRDGRPDVDPAVKACQQVLDEWRKFAGWGDAADHFDWRDLDGPDATPPSDRQAEAGLRAFRDGNAVLRFWAGGAGDDYLPTVRFVDPELVRNPSGALRDGDGRPFDGNADWGVVTAANDPEKRLGMWVVHKDDPGDGEFVPAGRLCHLKLNVDGTVKLGVPDFFPVADGLEHARKLLRNMGETGGVQSAIAWITQHSGGVTETEVRRMLEAGKSYSYSRPEVGGGVTQVSVRKLDSATQLHVNNGQQLVPGPGAVNAQQFIAIEQAILRAAGMRFGFPEYFSGDSSNANYASTLVSGGPAERAFKRRQKDVKAFEQAVAMRVLAFAVRAGRLTPEQVRAVTVEVKFPSVAIADKDKDSARRVSLINAKVMSPQTAAAEEELDPTVEAANIKAWAAQFPAAPAPFAGGGGPTTEAVRHKGKGPGGGQFVGSGGGGGGKSSPRKSKATAPENQAGTSGADHPLAGKSPGEQRAEIGRLRNVAEQGNSDPMGLRAAGPPEGLDMRAFAAALGDHAAKTDVGLNADEAYEAVGKPAGLSKWDFLRAVTAADDDGAVRFGMWGRSPDDIPDPELAGVLGSRIRYTIYPGEARRESADLVAAGWLTEDAASLWVGDLVAEGRVVAEAVTWVAGQHPRAKDGTFIKKNEVDDARAAYAKGDKAPMEALRAKVRPQDKDLLDAHLAREPHAGDARAFHPAAQAAGHIRTLGWVKGNKLVDHVGGYLDKITEHGPLTPEERRDLTVAVGNAVRSAQVPQLRNILRSMAVPHAEFVGKGKEELAKLVHDKVKAALWDTETSYHARAADPDRQPAGREPAAVG